VITYITEEELFRLQISSTPEINAETWRLKFSGLVENEFMLTYDEIKKMPQKTVYATLETISNPIGGPMIGSAFWTGVPFSYLLEKAGIKEGALEVVFYCADQYSTSITIEEAMKEDAILAYRINGELLPKYHGYPARMVLPDKYGMKWAKWINEIEIVDYDYKGCWEEQGGSDYAGRDRPDQRFD
jgi:DMSO/TMAO reductase YedYZ molybdopterin-dependent catalytic subunit